ncbi:MAG: L,D-transpeptidase [Ilumatobacteraceae bacterium]
MSNRRVVLGASIVGVVGAAVALALAIGPQVGSDSAAGQRPELPPTEPDVAVAVTEPTAGDTATDMPQDGAVAGTSPAVVPRRGVPADRVLPRKSPAPVQAFAFADPATCPAAGQAAVVDRDNQRAWLCGDGAVTHELPITSAWSQPDPGDYAIYAKDMQSSSTFSGEYSTMTHFVAFSYGEFEGARIAFHSVPTYPDGSFIQPLASVGALEQRGNSAGCIRVLPRDAELIWSWLEVGDTVRVVS